MNLRRFGLLNVYVVVLLSGCSKETSAQQVRQPAVAGPFYPDEPTRLTDTVKSYLKNARTQVAADTVLGLMVPHAGYVFSGQTAGCAYKQIEGAKFTTVVILGCPHKHPVHGVSVWNGGSYRMPLGDVPIDTDLVAKLIAEDEKIRFVPAAHAKEHSLEVQLPFLQTVLKEKFKIVPILVGYGADAMGAISRALAKHLRERTDVLLLASSDMTHYPPYKDAQRIDIAVLRAIGTFDPAKVTAQMAKHPPNRAAGLSCVMCGDRAVLAVMDTVKQLGANRAVVLNYSNSGDGPIGDPKGVVGYGAVAFVKAPPDPAAEPAKSFSRVFDFDPLSESAQKELRRLARSAIETYLAKKTFQPAEPTDSSLRHCRGAFVTITKDGDLRGCIGHHLDDLPLYIVVPKMAVQSAFGDRRFGPLRKEELSRIKIKVSAYTCRTYRAQSIDEFKVGQHGIIMSKGRRGSTFLPEIPVEQGWDKETELRYLCRKAGLPQDGWKDGAVFHLYKTQRFSE